MEISDLTPAKWSDVRDAKNKHENVVCWEEKEVYGWGKYGTI